MELNEIAKGLADRFGLGELAVEDGEAALEIDGMPVLLSEGEGAAIVMTGLVGEPPAEGGEAFANLLLEGTMSLMDERAAALARNPETGAYALVARVPREDLTIDAFCEELSGFVNRLESWRAILDGFRPAAAASKAAAAAEPSDRDIAMGGFIQV